MDDVCTSADRKAQEIYLLAARMLPAFLRPSANGSAWERYTPLLSRTPYRRDHDTLMIHQDDAAQVMGGA
jgi:hypothetical protein